MEKTSYTWDELTKALATGENVLGLGWECTHEITINRTTDEVKGVRIERRKRRVFEDRWLTLIKGSSDAWAELHVKAPMVTSTYTETYGEIPTDWHGTASMSLFASTTSSCLSCLPTLWLANGSSMR